VTEDVGPAPESDAAPANGPRSPRDLARERVDAVNERAGRNLPAAITVGLVLISFVVASLAWWNWGFVVFVALALIVGAVELHVVMRDRAAMRSAIVPIVIGTVAIVVGSYLAAQRPGRLPSTTVLLASFGLTVVAALMWRMWQGPVGFVRDSAASLLTIAYLPLLGSFLTLMLGEDHGPLRVAATILCVSGSDTGGYIAGVLFGRHKLAPRISPKKTWEGLAGSFVLAMAVGAAMAHFALGAPFWVGLLLGAVLVVTGTSGDLVESMIKRDLGVKDMSNFLPGHGGVMDRIDSVLLAAPAAWLVMFLLVPRG